MTDTFIRKRIMFYVQHLLGIGHLARALRLTRHLQQAGMDVTIVSGGMPHPFADLHGENLVQLAPVRAADVEFSRLLDASGNVIDDNWRAGRKSALLQAFVDCAPDALIVEMFPFGRRQFSFELLPLLQAAKARQPAPLILCSVRDIVIPSAKAGRTQEAIARAKDYFDHILVHGDANFLTIEENYPAALDLADKVFYTGYVTADTDHADHSLAGKDEVTISAGGGVAGEALLQTAMRARALSTQAGKKRWRILVGASAPQGQLQSLCDAAPSGVIVEPARADFPQMLFNCACSVSQAGYNTVMDILRAKAVSATPAVIVPFAAAREREQTVRAQALARSGLATVLPETLLTPASLAAAIDQAMTQKSLPARIPDMNGGVAAARFIQERLNG